MQDYRRAFATVAAIAVGAAVFLPVIFGEAPSFEDRHGGDLWRNTIMDFQTLITGVLAGGAAIWAVIEMRAIDRKADSRHKENLHLALEPDFRVVKTAHKQTLKLQILKRIAVSFNSDLSSAFSSGSDFCHWCHLADANARQFRDVSTMFEQAEWKEAEPLFDDDLRFWIARLKNTAQDIVETGASIGKIGTQHEPVLGVAPSKDERNHLQSAVNAHENCRKRSIEAAHRVIALLDELYKKYERLMTR